MTTLEHAPPDFLSWVATLVHRHRAELLRYARRRGMAAEDALDAVQDTFVTFLDLPDARVLARSGRDAVKLLTVILRNHVLNRRRKRARQADGLQELGRARGGEREESSVELIERAEEFARAQVCILRLARLQRAVIELSLVDGEPHESIAQRLGITAGHARVLLHRAREHVRNCGYNQTPVEETPARARQRRAASRKQRSRRA